VSTWFKVDPKWLEESLPFIFVSALLGARIYHLVTDWQLYQGASFFDLIAVWKGGLGFLGAIFGGLLGLILWLKFNHHKLGLFFRYMDLLVFGLPIAQIIGRFGNFFNQELYGLPTDLPWGIMVHGASYHPLFIYEGIANLLLFVFLITLGQRKAFVLGKGQYAFLYLFCYAFIRFWLEYLRLETAHFDGAMGIFSIAQWICLMLMSVSAILFWTRRHAPKKLLDFSLD
jgi:prolipoprotein diacylglyceryl transferase